MPDYPDDGYPEMVCIETTNAASDVRTIASGESHTMAQTFAVD
jgi:D-hexose-6-phosphate mutarotase